MYDFPCFCNYCRNDYKDYVEVCFKEFGDRVKHWITFNEPAAFCSTGYASGVLAPGRCSPWELGKCSAGDSGREPYTVCHHQLLAHAEAVHLYKEKYQVRDELASLLPWYQQLQLRLDDEEHVQMSLLIHPHHTLMIWTHCSHLLAGFAKRENRSNFKLPMVSPFVPIQIQWWCSEACLRFHAWMVNSLWRTVRLRRP